jgi:hypothetical protein
MKFATGPHVPKFYALIDTGATRNYIADTLIDRFGWRSSLKPVNRTAQGLGGELRPILGEITLTFWVRDNDLTGRKFTLPFDVIQKANPDVESAGDIVLGYPWLKEACPKLDFDRLLWTMSSETAYCGFCGNHITAKAYAECGHKFDFHCAVSKFYRDNYDSIDGELVAKSEWLRPLRCPGTPSSNVPCGRDVWELQYNRQPDTVFYKFYLE